MKLNEVCGERLTGRYKFIASNFVAVHNHRFMRLSNNKLIVPTVRHFLPVLLSLHILSYPHCSVFSSISCMPFSFPAPPSALLHSTTFPFTFFNVLRLHHRLLLQPLKHLYSCFHPPLFILFFCCTFTSNCLHISSFFNFHSFIFFSPICFFFFFRFVTFRSALSRRCCVKHASPRVTLQSLTRIPLAILIIIIIGYFILNYSVGIVHLSKLPSRTLTCCILPGLSNT